ncbi:SRPBCC family protein [Pseudofrankia inefficax]|uniref:Cyclase/dehydrase n=1 Tax=Pseudofrankia inefficax (strain DSM 45817 / CECT 9037 / DDB 130130 / EuI1c) TaxID=298654 RepID=E3J789_PSEI1|nr:SRPBCC family protein [Pseudofrankia inefficax]ADP84453.1 cyclase/dehydrase [Pseudofrankia inefficax]
MAGRWNAVVVRISDKRRVLTATTVAESIDVSVPVRTAYNQWTQFESFPHFMTGVESIEQLDATHTHWHVKVGGQDREFDAAITEQLPDERVAWKSLAAGHAGTGRWARDGALPAVLSTHPMRLPPGKTVLGAGRRLERHGLLRPGGVRVLRVVR